MKILLIMPRFFDYPEAISKELNNLGYDVDCFDDRPSTKGLVKAIIRINKNLIYHYIKSYFNRMMTIIYKNKYDVVLLISGQSLSLDQKMIETIKKHNPMRNSFYINGIH